MVYVWWKEVRKAMKTGTFLPVLTNSEYIFFILEIHEPYQIWSGTLLYTVPLWFECIFRINSPDLPFLVNA